MDEERRIYLQKRIFQLMLDIVDFPYLGNKDKNWLSTIVSAWNDSLSKTPDLEILESSIINAEDILVKLRQTKGK